MFVSKTASVPVPLDDANANAVNSPANTAPASPAPAAEAASAPTANQQPLTPPSKKGGEADKTSGTVRTSTYN